MLKRQRAGWFFVLACATFGAGGQLAADTHNLLVAAGSGGQFKSVQKAVMAMPAGSAANPVFIHLKSGSYKELLYIQREKRFFHLLGGTGPGANPPARCPGRAS
jgi:pectin methylesterase-like acyl-CoA thioesterase